MHKVIEVIVLGLLLVAVTAPVAYKSFAQTSIIKGEVATGVYENVKTDGTGRLQVTSGGDGISLSGVTASSGTIPVTISNVNATATYTFSSISVTSVTKQLTLASTARKALLLQNNSTSYNMYVGNSSPVTATSGFTLIPSASFFVTQAVPASAWFVLGASAVSGTIQVGEAY